MGWILPVRARSFFPLKKENPEGNWSSAIGTPPSDYENIVKNQDIIRIK